MTDFVVKKGLQIGGGTKLKSGTIAGNATLDLSSGNYFAHTPTADTTFVFSNPPAAGKAHGFALKVTGADIGASYDIANAVYDSVSFSVSGQAIFHPTSVQFKPDGTKMYVLGVVQDKVFQYTLTTAWDVSTASYDSINFSVAVQESNPYGLAFKPDGTKMYIIGVSSDSVHQYSLSTAFDISTASYDSVSFSVLAQTNFPFDLQFKPDGTKMYIVDGDASRVLGYDLATAWDISTSSYVALSPSVGLQPTGVFFSTDGDQFFVTSSNTDDVRQFSLSVPWDVSTASYDSVSFSIASQETVARTLFFKPDGTKMYIAGEVSDAVFQYTTGTTDIATFTYPASVKFPNDVPPTAPAVGETDVLTFYTEDGGTTYYGFQAGDAMQ